MNAAYDLAVRATMAYGFLMLKNKKNHSRFTCITTAAAILIIPSFSRSETIAKLPPANTMACQQNAVEWFILFDAAMRQIAIRKAHDLAEQNMIELRQYRWDTDDFLMALQDDTNKDSAIKKKTEIDDQLLQIVQSQEWIEQYIDDVDELAAAPKITIEDKSDQRGGFDTVISFSLQERLMFPRANSDLHAKVDFLKLHYAPMQEGESFADTPMRQRYKVTTVFGIDEKTSISIIDRSGFMISMNAKTFIEANPIKYSLEYTYLAGKKWDFISWPHHKANWFIDTLGLMAAKINRCRDAYKPA